MGFRQLATTQWDVVREFVRGNVKKGVELLEKYSPPMREYIHKKGFGNEVDDIVQMAYLKVIAWVKRNNFDETKGSFRGMLIHCIHLAMVEEYRKKKVKYASLDFDPEKEPDLTLWHEVYFEGIRVKGMELLKERVDEKSWLAFLAVMQDDKSPEEVAVMFSEKRQWVYDVKSRLLEMLREICLELDLDA